MTPVDVRPFACPLTWVKARLALERAAAGDRVEVWLREGEPLASVPRSALEDGHRVLLVERLPEAGDWRVVLEKGGAAPAELP